jgi:hypothetical protein
MGVHGQNTDSAPLHCPADLGTQARSLSPLAPCEPTAITAAVGPTPLARLGADTSAYPTSIWHVDTPSMPRTLAFRV